MRRSVVLSLFLFLAAAGTRLLLAQVAAPDPREEFATAFDFGSRFFEAGDFAAALTFFENADSVMRDQPATLFNVALVLVRLERYDEAQQRLNRFVQLYPQSPHGDSVKKLQREIQFAVEVRKRERRDSEYRRLFNRGLLLNEKGDRREALDAFRQAEQLNAGDPPLLFNMAAIHEAEGDVERAVALYKSYVATEPDNRSDVDRVIFELENEIVDKRTKVMCPFCGEKLPAGAHWCHRCWHGPYELDGALAARACGNRATITRTATDVAGKVRSREVLACMYSASSMNAFVQYGRQRQQAVWKLREAEGWSRTGGALASRARAGVPELRLEQTTFLSSVELLPAGERFEFAAHQTADGIWLLDREPYADGDQIFDKRYVYDSLGRIASEQVTYESDRCHHVISFTATYTYGDYGVTSAIVRGSYDGARSEGAPHVQWEATVSRQFHLSGRLLKEEVQVGTYQKTWMSKPSGPVGTQVRAIYPGLKPKRAMDVRAIGDLCGQSGSERLEEPIDLRSLYTLSPALAVRLAPGVTRVAVDYASPPN